MLYTSRQATVREPRTVMILDYSVRLQCQKETTNFGGCIRLLKHLAFCTRDCCCLVASKPEISAAGSAWLPVASSVLSLHLNKNRQPIKCHKLVESTGAARPLQPSLQESRAGVLRKRHQPSSCCLVLVSHVCKPLRITLPC